MTARVQQARISANNSPPANGSLSPGQLFVEMGTPLRLWGGVPSGIDATGRKLILDADANTTALGTKVAKAGDTMTGPLVLAGVSTAPNAAPGTNTLQIANTAYVVTALAPYALTSSVPVGSASAPVMDGTAAAGAATAWARGDHVHPTDTTRYAASNPSGYQTTAQVATAVAPALNNVGRNYLHNPLFNVAQRGAGPFTAAGYTGDRWTNNFSGGSQSFVNNAVTDASRAQIGDEAATWSLTNTFTGAAAVGSYNLISQRIEGIRRLAGKTVTVSFWAATTAGTLKLGVSIDQYFGSGGSPSASVNVAGIAVTLNTTWARYSATLTLPSIAGKTLGTANDAFSSLNFWYSAEASTFATRSGGVGVQSGTIFLWGVQLEIGTVMTPLEKPDPQQDLAKCQRFYQIGYFNYSGSGTGGVSTSMSQQLPVAFRAAPTFVNTGGGAATNFSNGVIAAAGAPMNSSFYIAGNPTATGAFAFFGNYSASADL